MSSALIFSSKFFVSLLPYFLIIIFLKIILNVYRLTKTCFYLSKYDKYLDEQYWHFKEYEHGIVKIFKVAGISDSYKSLVEPVGSGQIRTTSISIFSNIGMISENIPLIVKGMFHRAIGVFKSRIFESINPVFWLELLIFMPKHIFEYLNIEQKNIVVKIAQLIYWFFSIVKILKELFDISII